MEITIDIYYRNKETGKFAILHETITEDDIKRIAEIKAQESQPLWLNENHELHSVEFDKITI